MPYLILSPEHHGCRSGKTCATLPYFRAVREVGRQAGSYCWQKAAVAVMTRQPGRTIIAAMRRLLMILLMLILPLQWSTAAVAAYCQHEAEVGAQHHFGHHEHQHEKAKIAEKADNSGSSAFDSDCPTCHFLATPVIFSSSGLAKLPPPPQSITLYVGVAAERYPDTPFRPPLAFLA